MRRLPLVLVVAAALVVLGLLSSVVTQGFEELAATRAERRALEAERDRLEARIRSMEATLDALEHDPEAVESVARRDLGWVRPGETVYLLATPTPPPAPLTDPEAVPILSLPD